jgi:hypothetical protein
MAVVDVAIKRPANPRERGTAHPRLRTELMKTRPTAKHQTHAKLSLNYFNFVLFPPISRVIRKLLLALFLGK